MVNYALVLTLWHEFPTWDIYPVFDRWAAVSHPTPTSMRIIVEPTIEALAKRLRNKNVRGSVPFPRRSPEVMIQQ
jgi:hypothetical protein